MIIRIILVVIFLVLSAFFSGAEIVYSKEFRQCWSIKKDNIKVCKDCELRYNCIDCRAGHQVDNGSKPVGCNYDPYKLIWNDEHK